MADKNENESRLFRELIETCIHMYHLRYRSGYNRNISFRNSSLNSELDDPREKKKRTQRRDTGRAKELVGNRKIYEHQQSTEKD